jgi:hypothetical protein
MGWSFPVNAGHLGYSRIDMRIRFRSLGCCWGLIVFAVQAQASAPGANLQLIEKIGSAQV